MRLHSSQITGSLNVSSSITFGTNLSDGTIAITAFADEDAMGSNSATLIPTQQSVKAYVDSQVTAQDLDATTDSGTIDIDLDPFSFNSTIHLDKINFNKFDFDFKPRFKTRTD